MSPKKRQIRDGDDMKPQFDQEKFTEMVLYIAETTMDDPEFGVIKMAKALWKADFVAFAKLGKPISGAEYQKLDNGPAAREFIPAFGQMQKDRSAEHATQDIGGFKSRRLVALREADLSKFTAEEMAIIHGAIAWVRPKTASALSRESHGWAWEAVDMKETIPYGSELFPDDPLPPSDAAREFGRKVFEELEL